MNQPVPEFSCVIAGHSAEGVGWLDVHNPYNGDVVGRVAAVGREAVERAIESARQPAERLSRYQRYSILDEARRRVVEQAETLAVGITQESGLCLREGRYEVGRAADVLQFAAQEALRDDGQVFSCDVSPQGKARKIFTLREPVDLAVAITPFNHPLNQVAHKVAPAIAAGAPMILKPSEKTPLTALRFAEILYQAGLPGPMLSVLLGPTDQVAEALVRDERVSVVAFTGSVAIGKRIAATAGYKKTILELGGNDPLIVLDDAELELAIRLAAEGAFRNSGQRCTAVKRLLVHRDILEEFTEGLVERASEYRCGDPMDPETRVGTVIDEASAVHLEAVLSEAVEAGARILYGGQRRGALMEPTVIADVPRQCRMVMEEAFGPLAPIIAVDDLEDAIEVANSTAYGLSSGIVTNRWDSIQTTIRRLRVGTVNINEVPGYRIESSPFGGIKDSGLGVKEGVIEAIKGYSTVKTFSLPWPG